MISELRRLIDYGAHGFGCCGWICGCLLFYGDVMAKLKYKVLIEIDFTGDDDYQEKAKYIRELASRYGDVFSTHLNKDKTCAYQVVFDDVYWADHFCDTLWGKGMVRV